MLRTAILTACAAIAMMAQTTVIQPSAPNPVTETRTFALKSGGRLKIDNTNGGIKISAWDKDEVALTANFTPSSRNKAHSKIKVKSNINSLELIIEHPREWNEVGSCQLELKVPGSVASNIQTVNGSITINGITGKNNTETTNGNIVMENVGGNVKAETTNGGIVMKNVSGNIKAETTNGGIVMENVSGNINAETTNGSVTGSIQNIEDVVDISTTHGNIRFKLLNPKGSFTASTDYGNIRIPPGAENVNVDKDGNSSTVRAKYDGKAKIRFITGYGSITVQ